MVEGLTGIKTIQAFGREESYESEAVCMYQTRYAISLLNFGYICNGRAFFEG